MSTCWTRKNFLIHLKHPIINIQLQLHHLAANKVRLSFQFTTPLPTRQWWTEIFNENFKSIANTNKVIDWSFSLHWKQSVNNKKDYKRVVVWKQFKFAIRLFNSIFNGSNKWVLNGSIILSSLPAGNLNHVRILKRFHSTDSNNDLKHLVLLYWTRFPAFQKGFDKVPIFTERESKISRRASSTTQRAQWL